MKRILVASDLSVRSDRALQRAVALAHDFNAALTIVTVVDDSLPKPFVARHVDEARESLRQQISSLPLANQLNVETLIVEGHDYREIIALSEQKNADLIVVGVHRHDTPEAFRGTTAERVIRFGACPVLVVKDAVVHRYRRALIGVDLSIHSRAALDFTASLVPKGEIFLVHAAEVPFKTFMGHDGPEQYIDGVQAQFSELVGQDLTLLRAELGESMPKTEILVIDGDPHQVIRQELERLKPDLLALGTHGRTGIARVMLGSVAEDLLADAPIDVLAIKAPLHR